jgi:hypothetical protein
MKVTIELDAYELQLLNLAISLATGFFPQENLQEWLSLTNKINFNNPGYHPYTINATKSKDHNQGIFARAVKPLG